jgi:hypothetical protein
MNKRIVNTLVLFLENVGAAIWVGALVTFGFAVAGAVFHELPSITVAGNLNAKILAQLNRLEFSAAALMAIAAVYFLLQAEERTRLRLVKTGLLVLMICALVTYATIIADRLEHLRTVEIQDFDNFDVTKQAFRAEFHQLHSLYTRLVGANLFMGLGFLLLSAFERS